MPGPTSSNAVTAAVVRNKGGPFTIEKLRMGEPRDDEVLVRIVATGMCHTDMIVRDQMYPVPQPIVLGHEGAGVVEKVGPSVTKVKPRRPRGPELHVLRGLPAMRSGAAEQLREFQRPQFQRRTRRRQPKPRRRLWPDPRSFLRPVVVLDLRARQSAQRRQGAEGSAARAARPARLRHSDRRRRGDERAQSRSRREALPLSAPARSGSRRSWRRARSARPRSLRSMSFRRGSSSPRSSARRTRSTPARPIRSPR